MVLKQLRGISSAKRLYKTIIYNPSRTIICSTSTHLTQRLIQEPISRIKTTLDSEITNKNIEISWDSILTSVHHHSPPKAQLVLEWRLEKLLTQNEKNDNMYSDLIHLCSKIHSPQTAMWIFTSMESRGRKPSSNILNALISAHLSSNNLVAALSIYETMQNLEDYKPTAHTYNLFISAFANLRNSKAMLAWYSTKIASGFLADLDTYEALILGCIKLKRFEDAERFYGEMLVAGIKPNELILHNLLVGFCEQKESVKLRAFLKDTLENKSMIDGYLAEKLVGFYCDLELVDEMEWVLVELTEAGHNQDLGIVSRIYNGLIRVYAKLDRLDDMEYSIGRMLKQGVSFRSDKDVENVICSYFHQGAYGRLDVFLEFMKGSCMLARSSYELLLDGYRRAGLGEKVDLVIKDLEILEKD
ncbi:putative tetratricopeptide-like helical domain superfamily [Helianthus annuus]|nr:putative tetratricopeptide-like helical domain superfamily [Helianthus annuus]